MTPTVVDLLNGCIRTLATPPRPEDTGLFAIARLRTVALINRLAAIEAADGTAARVWENAALRALFTQAAAIYPEASHAAGIGDGDFSLEALDAANASLRRLLIELHEVAELAGDAALDRTILMLYREMAGGANCTFRPSGRCRRFEIPAPSAANSSQGFSIDERHWN